MAAIRAVIFDIGDTLVDATRIERDSLAAAVEDLVRCGLAELTCPLVATYPECASRLGKSRPPHLNRLFGLPFAMFVEACEVAGLHHRATHIAFAAYQRTVRARIVANAGLVRLFQTLKRDHGVLIGIASDGTTPEQLETLQRLGVLEFVDAVAISDVVGVTKPDAQLFDQVLRELGVTYEQAIMVGDSPDNDVQAASSLGMSVIHITRDTDRPLEFAQVRSVQLGDAQSLLNLLRPAIRDA